MKSVTICVALFFLSACLLQAEYNPVPSPTPTESNSPFPTPTSSYVDFEPQRCGGNPKEFKIFFTGASGGGRPLGDVDKQYKFNQRKDAKYDILQQIQNNPGGPFHLHVSGYSYGGFTALVLAHTITFEDVVSQLGEGCFAITLLTFDPVATLRVPFSAYRHGIKNVKKSPAESIYTVNAYQTRGVDRGPFAIISSAFKGFPLEGKKVDFNANVNSSRASNFLDHITIHEYTQDGAFKRAQVLMHNVGQQFLYEGR